MTRPAPEWLERANRLALLSRLYATTVHDVNNALQVITGSAELLELNPSAQTVGRRSTAIAGQARRATDLLAELTGFARDESDSRQPVPLRSLAERALALRQQAFRKQKVATSIEGGDPVVQASPRRLLQVILNLLVNAEQALAGQSEGRLRLVVSDGAGHASLSVEDDGPGVDAGRQSHLFDWHYAQAPGSTVLGIGLPVASWIASEHGGALQYRDNAPRGAVFTLSLPRK